MFSAHTKSHLIDKCTVVVVYGITTLTVIRIITACADSMVQWHFTLADPDFHGRGFFIDACRWLASSKPCDVFGLFVHKTMVGCHRIDTRLSQFTASSKLTLDRPTCLICNFPMRDFLCLLVWAK